DRKRALAGHAGYSPIVKNQNENGRFSTLFTATARISQNRCRAKPVGFPKFAADSAAAQIHAGRSWIFQDVEMDVKRCEKRVKKGLKWKYSWPLPALSYRVSSRRKCPKTKL